MKKLFSLTLLVISLVLFIGCDGVKEKTYHAWGQDFVEDSDFIVNNRLEFNKSHLTYIKSENVYKTFETAIFLKEHIVTHYRNDSIDIFYTLNGDTLPYNISHYIYSMDNYIDFDSEFKRIKSYRDSTYDIYIERCIFMLCRCKEDSIVTSQTETYKENLNKRLWN